jgi:hypothetical protein
MRAAVPPMLEHPPFREMMLGEKVTLEVRPVRAFLRVGA